jgi:hypothetical protein
VAVWRLHGERRQEAVVPGLPERAALASESVLPAPIFDGRRKYDS